MGTLIILAMVGIPCVNSVRKEALKTGRAPVQV